VGFEPGGEFSSCAPHLTVLTQAHRHDHRACPRRRFRWARDQRLRVRATRCQPDSLRWRWLVPGSRCRGLPTAVRGARKRSFVTTLVARRRRMDSRSVAAGDGWKTRRCCRPPPRPAIPRAPRRGISASMGNACGEVVQTLPQFGWPTGARHSESPGERDEDTDACGLARSTRVQAAAHRDGLAL